MDAVVQVVASDDGVQIVAGLFDCDLDRAQTGSRFDREVQFGDELAPLGDYPSGGAAHAGGLNDCVSGRGVGSSTSCWAVSTPD